jgi:hypothetical protein
MTQSTDRKIAIRARLAYERMYGQSTWIEARYTPLLKSVTVIDHERNVYTFWNVDTANKHSVKITQRRGDLECILPSAFKEPA